MDKTFTQNDYLHLQKLEKCIKSGASLEDIGFLTKKEMTPSEATLSNILNFSKALSVRESQLLGNIELVLN